MELVFFFFKYITFLEKGKISKVYLNGKLPNQAVLNRILKISTKKIV